MRAMELGELLEGVLADNVRVENKERRVVLLQNISGKTKRTSGAEGLGLDGESDGDVVELLVLFKSSHHDLGAVVDS